MVPYTIPRLRRASRSRSLNQTLAFHRADKYCTGTINENASPTEGNSWNSSNAQFASADASSTLVSPVTRAKFHFNYATSRSRVHSFAARYVPEPGAKR